MSGEEDRKVVAFVKSEGHGASEDFDGRQSGEGAEVVSIDSRRQARLTDISHHPLGIFILPSEEKAGCFRISIETTKELIGLIDGVELREGPFPAVS